MRLRRKLFLANLAAVGGVVLLALFSQQFLTRADFDDYRRANIALAAEALAAEVAREYSLTGRWDSVLQSAWRWPDMYPPLPRQPVRQPGGPLGDRRLPPPDQGRRPARGDFAPPDGAPALLADDQRRPSHESGPPPFRRFMLLDSVREPLSRGRLDLEHASWQAIETGGVTVGYLAWNPVLTEVHPLDAAFAERQQRALMLIAVGAVVLSILSAWGLSGQLLSRIRSLLAATRRVSAGQLDTVVPEDSADELGDLAAAFNRMTSALAESAARERRWIADAAHELRTPLAVLKGEIEALQDGVRTLDDKALASLHQEVRHLGTLVDDLHLVSSAESGGLRLHRQAVNLKDIADVTFRGFSDTFKERGLELAVHVPEILALDADEARLRQVLMNLLQNLLRYADPGMVIFCAREMGNDVEIHLSDSGPGVPADALPRLFDRLYQHDPARHKLGSGLGLSIVRSIVRAHGGDVFAVASDLGGLDIVIRWPAAQ